MSSWFYADANNARQGPVDGRDLARWLGEGRLHWGTLVWRDGMGDWRPMSDFADEFTALAAAPPGATQGDPPAVAATPFATSGITDPRSDAAPPGAGAAPFAATPRPAPGMASPYAAPTATLLHTADVYQGNEVVYAGFWKRVAAYIVDGLIVGIAGGIIGAVIGGVMGVGFGLRGGASAIDGGGMIAIQVVSQVVSLAITAAYFAFFHASRGQATPGKMAVGIKVTRSDGSPITVARGVGRYFGLLVSSLLLMVGLIMAAFTERKQALHDLMCDTLVVDKWAFTESPQLQSRELGTATIVILVLGALMFFGTVAVIIGLAATFGAAGR